MAKCKNIQTPKTWTGRDVYQDFATKLLKENPDWWGRYSKTRKMRNFWIYRNDPKVGKVIEVINYDRWMEVVSQYFIGARARIIEGEPLNMGNNVGRIEGRRAERNFANRRIDFHETSKRPKIVGLDGVARPDQIIYYTDNDWVRIAWLKTKKLTNETGYTFLPCEGDRVKEGFKAQFSRANKENQMLKYRYRFYPYIRKDKQQVA